MGTKKMSTFLIFLFLALSTSLQIDNLVRKRSKTTELDVTRCRTVGGSCIAKDDSNKDSCVWKKGRCAGANKCCVPKDDTLCTRIGGTCASSCTGDAECQPGSEIREGLCLAPESSALACLVPVYTNDEAVTVVTGAGFKVSSSGSCSDKTKKSCTSMTSIVKHTVDGMLGVKERAIAWAAQQTPPIPCDDWTITGGSEVGHANSVPYSHSLGFKFDVRPTDCLSGYLETFAIDGDYAWDDANNLVIHNEREKAGAAHWDLYFT